MSPKRITIKNPVSTVVAPEEALESSVEHASEVENVQENKAETATQAGVEAASETQAVEDAAPAVRSAPTRSTPAAQAANRARRIGGSAVRPSSEAASSDATETIPRAALTSLTKPESSKAATKPVVGDAAESVPTAKRGMTGRPGAKARVERVEKEAPSAEPERGFRLGVEAIIAAVLAVVAVALAVVNVLVWHPWQHTDKTAQVRGQILSSVNQATALVLSYDYRKWDASAAAAEVNLTGQFKTDYSNAMTGDLKGTGISTKTVVVGKVDNSGLVSINSKGTQATVAVYAERSKTNTANTDPVVDLLAIQVTTDKVNGKWLISKLSYID